jgi:dTDP-4-amino-4,6-dideoxygalactose transaminase
MNEQPAILGGTPEFPSELPPYNTIGEPEIEAALSVMKTGILSGFVANPGPDFLGGDVVIALEQAFCERFGVAYAVSVNSATSGLHAALEAAGVGTGDEVIVPPYSMAASATAAVMCGAKPVFADIEADTFCLDPARVVEVITPRTKAIMAVNIFGQPANLSGLRAIADEHGLILIEDNAQAPAAEYHGQWAGGIGDMGVFSLNRHKTMQCGEGGVVICNDAALAHKLRMVRNHGEAVLPEWSADQQQPGDESIIGYNYRLTSLQAAIALPQLQRLDELNRYRIDLADYLTEQLSGFDYFQPPVIRDGCSHVYYLYPMIFDPEKAGMSRDRFVTAMQAEGAPVANYVRPLYRLPLYRARFGESACYNPENFPIVERLWKESMVVTPICRPPLNTHHIDHFVTAIQKIYQHRKKIADLSAV